MAYFLLNRASRRDPNMKVPAMIPFLDLKAQYQSIKEEIDRAMLSVLDSAAFVLGPEVARFEDQFAVYHSAAHGIAVNTGTSALHLALLAAGVGPGDEVITVPFTFVATVSAIRYTGATPVFVDIDPVSMTLDPGALESAITSRTKVILPVHLYGQPADMDPILATAKRHGLTVIEDACQAHGAEYHGRRVGSLGDLAAFSFYPGKNLGAFGEGGAVTTSNAQYAQVIRMMRDWGQDKRYHHLIQGFNYRMEGLQGAILNVKLRYLDKWTDARRARAAAYTRLLQGSDVETPREMPYARHVYHIYAVRCADRNALQQSLQKRGIQTGLHYPIPVHLQPAHHDLGYQEGQLPHAEAAARQVLSLPLYPEMPMEFVEQVSAAVLDAEHVAR
jgi:dTDP-4-amino-4,6-dideoxygalactose transaminase